MLQIHQPNETMMKFAFKCRNVLRCVATVALSLCSSAAAETFAVSVNTAQAGAEISPNALGLSYETSLMLPGTNGIHYFSPNNKPLVAMFRTLGVKSLRIGGNSVDAPKLPVPDEHDVRLLFEFARAAGVKVIYSVRLQESTNSVGLPPATARSNAEGAARLAKLIHDDYADVLDCFAIGNEPSYSRKNNYEEYWPKWKAIRDVILAVFPEAKFCGPDQNPEPEFFRQIARNLGDPRERLIMLAQHTYSFGCSYRNPGEGKDVARLVPFDAAESREKMLSSNAYGIFQEIYEGLASAVRDTPLTFRLTECNSYWFSGLKGASDSYASALWSVDYLHWWAAHSATGLNFHTGDRTGGDLSMICRYAAFVTSAKGYEARPLAYGMKLFDLGGHGRTIPIAVSSATNLAAYATLKENVVAVTLINKAHGPGAKEQRVEIHLDRPLVSKAEIIFLRATNDDIASGSGDVTLGGATIKENGSWKGKWSSLRSAAGTNVLFVTMPPASAAVIRAAVMP